MGRSDTTPRLDVMRREIEEAHEVAKVAGIVIRPSALETYARRARNTGAEREAIEINCSLMRKAGQLLIEAGKAGLRETGRPTKGAKVARLRHSETQRLRHWAA